MQAVWVLAVSDEIISGHNGILTEQHAFALSEVMGLIDFYRNQLPKENVEQPATPLQPEHQEPQPVTQESDNNSTAVAPEAAIEDVPAETTDAEVKVEVKPTQR
jgi:hypothetical protein